MTSLCLIDCLTFLTVQCLCIAVNRCGEHFILHGTGVHMACTTYGRRGTKRVKNYRKFIAMLAPGLTSEHFRSHTRIIMLTSTYTLSYRNRVVSISIVGDLLQWPRDISLCILLYYNLPLDDNVSSKIAPKSTTQYYTQRNFRHFKQRHYLGYKCPRVLKWYTQKLTFLTEHTRVQAYYSFMRMF